MTEYGHRGWTRILLAPAVATLNAPTLAELAAANDVTRYVTDDGLNLPTNTEEIPQGAWAQDLIPSLPGRYSYSGGTLRGYRHRPPSDQFYTLCSLRSHWFLVVRRGVAVATAFTVGQALEVYEIHCGRRATMPTRSGEAVTFVVPITVQADTDTAAVHA
jgi:hypothetical protein